jgi:polyhydroxyalkanoate synthesis regulator phasin
MFDLDRQVEVIKKEVATDATAALCLLPKKLNTFSPEEVSMGFSPSLGGTESLTRDNFVDVPFWGREKAGLMAIPSLAKAKTESLGWSSWERRESVLMYLTLAGASGSIFAQSSGELAEIEKFDDLIDRGEMVKKENFEYLQTIRRKYKESIKEGYWQNNYELLRKTDKILEKIRKKEYEKQVSAFGEEEVRRDLEQMRKDLGDELFELFKNAWI